METCWVNSLINDNGYLSDDLRNYNIVKNKNILISSFSNKEDAPII